MLGIAHEPRTPALQPRERRQERRLSDWHDPHLVALAAHPQLLAIDIQIADIELHELVGPQPAAVRELEHRTIPQPERCSAARRVEQATRIGRREHARQVIPALRSTEPGRRALLHEAVLAQRRVERPDRRDATRNRGVREATLAERRQVPPQIRQRHSLGRKVAFACPSREIDEIGLVGDARALCERPARKIREQQLDRRAPRAANVGCRQARSAARRAAARHEIGRAANVVAVGVFYIHVQEGHIATLDQLVEAEIVEIGDDPTMPWYKIDAPKDATTMWYAAMRKQEKGIFLGTLTFRHCDHHSLLMETGWEEVPVEEIGPPGHAGASEIQPNPLS